MYINTIYLQEYGLRLIDVSLLTIIKQNKLEDLSVFIEDNITTSDVEFYQDKGLISFVKRGKSLSEKIRITPKGTKFLEAVTTPDITLGDEKMANYLMEMYLSVDENRIVGNKKSVVKHTAQFRQYCGLTLHQMYWLCDLFIQETKYTLKLENIFFEANKHRYGRFLDHIDDSKLYQFYNEKKEMVENYWKQKIKK